MLELDFPGLEIGVAQYAEGPTGTTVIRFVDKAIGAVDVRGGAPGAYNVDWLRWGYGWPNVDDVLDRDRNTRERPARRAARTGPSRRSRPADGD